MIIAITVSGTHKNMPTIPQILPQRAKERITTRGLIFRELPVSRGSIMFPIIN